MKKLRKISRVYYLRQIMACWMVFSMVVVMPVRVAMAVPPVDVITPVITDAGGANIIQSHMYTGIEVTTAQTIMASSNFSTVPNEMVNFSQVEGLSGAAVLNRISGGQTQFDGILKSQSDMSIFLLNPAGIVFGGGSSVNVGALVASSLNLSDDDFRSGLDSGTFNFTGGANAGPVENHGSISAETIALIGKHVINTGAINGDYVIMAAGDTVTISEVGSAVGVEVLVTVPPDVDTGEYLVDHYGAGRIEAQHVIFAAGDIWSNAYIDASGDGSASVKMDAKGYIEIGGEIYVEAEDGSDAVATVDIVAVVDVQIDNYITAHADNDYSGNAEATIDIDAGGNVDINDKLEAWTHAHYADGDATSNINISSGGSVYVNAEIKSGKAHTNDNYETGGNATANIVIDAVDDVYIDYSGKLKADAMANNNAASQGADAKIDVSAGGHVDIYGDVEAKAKDFWNGSDEGDVLSETHAIAEVFIDAGIDSDVSVYSDVIAEAKSQGSGSATATVDIDAGRDVYIYDHEGDTVKAKADALHTGDADATVNLTAVGNVEIYDKVEASSHAREGAGSATSTINVNAGEDIYIDAEVKAGGAHTNDESGPAAANINIDAGRDVIVDDDGKLKTDAHANDYSEDADTTIDISAGRNVMISGRGIEAKAHANDNAGSATANIIIAAGGDVTVDSDIKAKAQANDYAGNATAGVQIVAEGDVTVENGSGIYADAEAEDESGDAAATIEITTTDGSLLVENESVIEARANSYSSAGHATATVDIDADGDVTVQGESSISARARADARGDREVEFTGEATANTDITAGGNVSVISGEVGAYADTFMGTSVDPTTATMTVNAGGNVTVGDNNSESQGSLGASATANQLPGDAIATTTIDAEGDVTVEGPESYVYSSADTMNNSGNAEASTTVDAGGKVSVNGMLLAYYDDEYEGWEWEEALASISAGAMTTGAGNAAASLEIDAVGDVLVGTYGEITADADVRISGRPGERVASATVDIESCEDVIVDNLVGAYAESDSTSGSTSADVIVKAFGDVIVNSEDDNGDYGDNGVNGFLQIELNGNGGSNGQIEAVASGSSENTAGITVLAVGDVIVNNGSRRGHPSPFLDSREEIRAAAFNGHTNEAFVHIATRDGDDGDLIVSGQIGARTWDAWDIWEGDAHLRGENISTVEISAARDVIVNGGYALYREGEGPYVNGEGPYLNGEGPYVVDGGSYLVEGEEGGQILAAAKNGSVNTANVEIFADRDVIVHGAEIEYIEYVPNNGVYLTQSNGGGLHDGGQILALTWGSEGEERDLDENTSSIGIFAQRDVTIHGATITGEPLDIDNGGGLPNQTDDGQVLAGAHGYRSINDADIEIGAQVDVTIDGEVIAEAGTTADLTNEHYADIIIRAGGQLGGSGYIYAEADEVAAVSEASVTFFVTGLGNHVFDGEAWSWDGEDKDPEIVVGPVDILENEFGWIYWSWCEDCEDEEVVVDLFAPVAPLAQFEIPMIEGCPELVQAAAVELGITAETIQVGLGNGLALTPSIQACRACAKLVDAAATLRDEDGSRMAAVVQMFNALAPADAPFTAATAASIAMVFEGAAEGSQYASAMEYIDAFAQYVAVLDIELGSPVGDSVAFVMEKHGAGVMGNDNPNIAAFIATLLEAIGG